MINPDNPTIDEMLAYLDRYCDEWRDDPRNAAIRAILEQQRHMDAWYRGKENEVLLFRGKVELNAIRAFVERVEKKIQERGEWRSARIWDAIEQEVAAMEKEANARTND